MSLAVFLFGLVLVPRSAVAGDAPPMALPGQFDVSVTGAATYTIPIAVPPGTAGMAPSLSLDYSSQGGDGIVGLGWAVSGLPSITRCPRTAAQDGVHGGVNYDSNDRFCLDGQRLMAINGGTYGANETEYRTEIDGFSKIVSYGTAGYGPEYFKVWTKAGQIMEFGNSVDSKILPVKGDGTILPTIRAWAVNKVMDTKGNYFVAIYNCKLVDTDTTCTDMTRTIWGQAFPRSIKYTGNGSQQPYNSVTFTYAARPQTVITYQAGAMVGSTQRLTNITTYAGQTVVSDYRLSYNSDAGWTKRSRLEQVKLCDGIATNANCLAPTTFGWQGSRDTVSFTLVQNTMAAGATPDHRSLYPGDFNGDGLLDAIVALLPNGNCPSIVYRGTQSGTFTSTGDTNCFTWKGTFLLDFNGDGIVDVRDVQNEGGDTSGILRGDSLGHFSAVGSFNADMQRGVSTDFNGDGYADIYTQDVWYGNGTGSDFVKDENARGHVGSLSIGIPGDFDGDGCTDILRQGAATNIVYFCEPAIQTLENNVQNWSNITLGDFNGDGKTDIFTVGGTGAYIYFSTGTTLQPAAIGSGFTTAGPTVTGDWNGDGMTDIAQSDLLLGKTFIYISTGSSFVSAGYLTSFGDVLTVADWNNDGASDIWIQGSGDREALSTDFYPELLKTISNGLGATTTISYDRLNKNDSNDPNHPFYVRENATYPSIALDGPMYIVSKVDASDGLGTCTPPSEQHCYTSTYRYAGAKGDQRGRGFLGFHQRIVTDEETHVAQTTTYLQTYPFIGLVEQETKTIPGAQQDVVISSKTNHYGQRSYFDGSSRRFVFLASTVETSNDYDGTTPYAMPKIITIFSDPDDQDYDTYGNATRIVVCTKVKVGTTDPTDECNEAPNNWVQDGYVGVKISANTYTNDGTLWILGRLTAATTTSKILGWARDRNASFAYDSTGLLTSEFMEPDNCPYALETHYDYDSFGNKHIATVRNPGTCTPTITSCATTTAYTSNGQFPATITNCLNHTETWVYNSNFGAPSSHTGPNVVATSWDYDSFGRRTMETRADGTRTQVEYLYCSGVNNGSFACTPSHAAFVVRVTPQRTSGAQNGAISRTYYDALGRSIAQDVQGFDGKFIRVATEYDSFGRVLRASRPYSCVGASDCTGSETPLWITNAYDLLSRVSTTTGADGIVTKYLYQGLTASVTADYSTGTGHKNQTTTTIRNGYGQIVQVNDAKTGVTYYGYDPLGAMAWYKDANNKQTDFTYDQRGRKTDSTNPDMGQWHYTYDVLDRLITQQDAKGQTTTLSYDVLGRLIGETVGSDTSTWVYDCPDQYPRNQCYTHTAEYHAIGKLVAATSPNYSRTLQYDDIGRATSATITVFGVPYIFTTTYDQDGRIDTVTDPNFVERRVYNQYGYLTNLKDGATGGATLWTAVSMDASLHVTRETQGNGVVINNDFDANTGRPTDTDAGIGGGSSVANYAYTYDNLGNLTKRIDHTQSDFTEKFTYDQLNRMVSYQITGYTQVAVTYAKGGNVTSRSDLGTFIYGEGNDGPQEVTSCVGCTVNGIADPTFNYDPNGSMLSGAGREFNWTAFNMVSRITSGTTARVDFDYGAEHQKIRQLTRLNGGSPDATVFLTDPISGLRLEVFTPNGGATTWRHYLVADGKMTGVRIMTGTATTWRYFVLDHLSSVSILTDAAGLAVERMSYDAWGRRRCVLPNGPSSGYGSNYSCGAGSSSGIEPGYTGHDMLDDLGLIDMNARIYDPTLGRFLSADSEVENPYLSQILNRYSYVGNNPLSFTDPTGHNFLSGFIDAMVSVLFPIKLLAPIIREVPIIGTIITIGMGMVCGPLCAATAAAEVAGFTTGKISLAIKAFVITFAQAQMVEFVGDARIDTSTLTGAAEHAVMHGMIGGLASTASGGKFGSGFISAGASALASPYISQDRVVGTVESAVIGGTASVLGGGKFSNGAVTGAFEYLFNYYMHNAAVPKQWMDMAEDARVAAIYRQCGCYHDQMDDILVGYFWMGVTAPVGDGLFAGLGRLGSWLLGREINVIYSARVLMRAAEEPGPYHNFPETFDRYILQLGTRRAISQDYTLFELRGSLNGDPGTYQIGVSPSPSGNTWTITHRFFKPGL